MKAFNYRKPSEEQIAKMQALRSSADDLADVIEQTVPAGPEKTLALRQLQLTTYWANTAVMFPEGSL